MLPTSSADRREDLRAGFALAELVLALAILALVAAVALPDSSRDPGPAALRATALKVASVLKGDRNAAIRLGHEVMTRLDAPGRAVQSGAPGQDVLPMPRGADMHVIPGVATGASGVVFRPGGGSSGGAFVLRSRSAAYRIDVSAVTGRVSVSPAELPR